MLENWKDVLASLKRHYGLIGETNPKFLSAYRDMNASLESNGALDVKTRELIAVAVAVTTRCEACIASHTAQAVQAGATEAELSAALGVAVSLNAGAAFAHSMKAIDAYRAFGIKE